MQSPPIIKERIAPSLCLFCGKRGIKQELFLYQCNMKEAHWQCPRYCGFPYMWKGCLDPYMVPRDAHTEDIPFPPPYPFPEDGWPPRCKPPSPGDKSPSNKDAGNNNELSLNTPVEHSENDVTKIEQQILVVEEAVTTLNITMSSGGSARVQSPQEGLCNNAGSPNQPLNTTITDDDMPHDTTMQVSEIGSLSLLAVEDRVEPVRLDSISEINVHNEIEDVETFLDKVDTQVVVSLLEIESSNIPQLSDSDIEPLAKLGRDLGGNDESGQEIPSEIEKVEVEEERCSIGEKGSIEDGNDVTKVAVCQSSTVTAEELVQEMMLDLQSNEGSDDEDWQSSKQIEKSNKQTEKSTESERSSEVKNEKSVVEEWEKSVVEEGEKSADVPKPAKKRPSRKKAVKVEEKSGKDLKVEEEQKKGNGDLKMGKELEILEKRHTRLEDKHMEIKKMKVDQKLRITWKKRVIATSGEGINGKAEFEIVLAKYMKDNYVGNEFPDSYTGDREKFDELIKTICKPKMNEIVKISKKKLESKSTEITVESEMSSKKMKNDSQREIAEPFLVTPEPSKEPLPTIENPKPTPPDCGKKTLKLKMNPVRICVDIGGLKRPLVPINQAMLHSKRQKLQVNLPTPTMENGDLFVGLGDANESQYLPKRVTDDNLTPLTDIAKSSLGRKQQESAEQKPNLMFSDAMRNDKKCMEKANIEQEKLFAKVTEQNYREFFPPRQGTREKTPRNEKKIIKAKRPFNISKQVEEIQRKLKIDAANSTSKRSTMKSFTPKSSMEEHGPSIKLQKVSDVISNSPVGELTGWRKRVAELHNKRIQDKKNAHTSNMKAHIFAQQFAQQLDEQDMQNGLMSAESDRIIATTSVQYCIDHYRPIGDPSYSASEMVQGHVYVPLDPINHSQEGIVTPGSSFPLPPPLPPLEPPVDSLQQPVWDPEYPTFGGFGDVIDAGTSLMPTPIDADDYSSYFDI